MFGVRYVGNEKLYDRYGMELKKMNNVEQQIYDKGDQAHQWLKKISMRHDGLLPDAKFYASILRGDMVNLAISVKLTALSQKVLKKYNVIPELNKDIGISQSGVDDVLDLLSNSVILGSDFTLVFINDNDYLKHVPSYINQIKEYMTVHWINYSAGFIDYTDVWFNKYFKKWIIITNDTILQPNINFNNNKLANISSFDNKYWRSKIIGTSSKFASFVKFDSCILTFSCVVQSKYKNRIRVISQLSSDNYTIGSKFIDVYDKVFDSSTNYDATTTGLSQESRILEIKKCLFLRPSTGSQVFLSKLRTRMLNNDYKMLNINMIALKGTGKSRVSKKLAISKQLVGISNRNIYIIDSDLYGKWRYANYNVTIPKEGEKRISLDYNSIKKYDTDEHQSVYNVVAKDILEKNGIYDVTKVVKHGEKYFDVFSDYFVKHLEVGNYCAEYYFYDQVISSIRTSDEPSIVIVQTHTTSQNAVAGRSDLIMVLQSVNDNMIAIQERNPDTAPEELFLFMFYRQFVGPFYPILYPYEILYSH